MAIEELHNVEMLTKYITLSENKFSFKIKKMTVPDTIQKSGIFFCCQEYIFAFILWKECIEIFEVWGIILLMQSAAKKVEKRNIFERKKEIV